MRSDMDLLPSTLSLNFLRRINFSGHDHHQYDRKRQQRQRHHNQPFLQTGPAVPKTGRGQPISKCRINEMNMTSYRVFINTKKIYVKCYDLPSD